MPKTTHQKLMDCKEVAELFSLDERFVRVLAVAKVLPGFTMGKVWRFRREAIQEVFDKLSKEAFGALLEYDARNTLIIWFQTKNDAPLAFKDRLETYFRKILDEKEIYKHYHFFTITAHQPGLSYRKWNGKRIDNSAGSASGKGFDEL
jgi:hypothetical protein